MSAVVFPNYLNLYRRRYQYRRQIAIDKVFRTRRPFRQVDRACLVPRFSAVDNDYTVRLAHGGEPMRNNNGRSALAQLEQCLLNDCFGGVVKRARRLVQNENGGIFEEYARNTQPLFLTAGKFDASLADLRIVAVGQTSDICVDIRPFAASTISSSVAPSLP